MPSYQRNHLISIADIPDHSLKEIISRSVQFATKQANPSHILAGQVIGIYFTKTSTRTRTAFSSAALRMGAHIISFGPNDLQTNTGECIEDTAKILSSMLDGIVMRTAESYNEMRIFASQDRMSVINAMSSEEHPTQALTDLSTIQQLRGGLSDLRLIYLGEGNNTASALTLSLSRFPNNKLFLYTPPGYGLPQNIINLARRYAEKSGSEIFEMHSVNDLPSDIEVIYTTRWQTTGTKKSELDWRKSFEPFTVSKTFMDIFPKSVFMHDLPAHRGEEVDGSVLDGPNSVAFLQAENKLYSAMAILEWCLHNKSNS